MPIQEPCRIIDHVQIAPNTFKLTLISSYLSTHAKPGQFALVRIENDSDPLLRRPLSFHQIKTEHKMIEIVYEAVGKGTKILSQKKIGENLDLIGPLGNGFDLTGKEKFSLIVGGGIGIAPMLALALGLRLKGKKVATILGARHKDRLLAQSEFEKLGDVLTCTDDGSCGTKALLADRLEAILENEIPASKHSAVAIYACGPSIVLKLVAEIAAQKGIPCQLSLEEKMACGIGACLGCAVKTNAGYKKVCNDGPVFNANELVWEAK
jgi:dihydroorotate dehydrogenase electron transfer subunit